MTQATEMERHHDVLFIPTAWEERVSVISKALMPASGPADTVEGEMVRAMNRIAYRYYNDGDYWYRGYGIETAGSAAAFLQSPVIPKDVRAELSKLVDDSDGKTKNDYEIAVFAIVKKVVEYVEAQNLRADLHPNSADMLDFDPKYELEEEDDWDEFEDDEEF